MAKCDIVRIFATDKAWTECKICGANDLDGVEDSPWHDSSECPRVNNRQGHKLEVALTDDLNDQATTLRLRKTSGRTGPQGPGRSPRTPQSSSELKLGSVVLVPSVMWAGGKNDPIPHYPMEVVALSNSWTSLKLKRPQQQGDMSGAQQRTEVDDHTYIFPTTEVEGWLLEKQPTPQRS